MECNAHYLSASFLLSWYVIAFSWNTWKKTANKYGAKAYEDTSDCLSVFSKIFSKKLKLILKVSFFSL